MVLGINYRTDREGSVVAYNGVRVRLAGHDEPVVFDTGDVVTDFRAAIEHAREWKQGTGEHIMFSSDVDSFLMDTNGKYAWHEDGYLIEVSPLDEFVSTFDTTDLDEGIMDEGDRPALWEAFLRLRRRHAQVVEENTLLHNMLSALCDEAPLRDVVNAYQGHLENSHDPDYVLAPLTVMALEVIEVLCAPRTPKANAYALIEKCFQAAHVALGICSEDHSDWIADLVNAHRRMKGGDSDE